MNDATANVLMLICGIIGFTYVYTSLQERSRLSHEVADLKADCHILARHVETLKTAVESGAPVDHKIKMGFH